jgi:hypothetical protein
MNAAKTLFSDPRSSAFIRGYFPFNRNVSPTTAVSG